MALSTMIRGWKYLRAEIEPRTGYRLLSQSSWHSKTEKDVICTGKCASRSMGHSAHGMPPSCCCVKRDGVYALPLGTGFILDPACTPSTAVAGYSKLDKEHALEGVMSVKDPVGAKQTQEFWEKLLGSGLALRVATSVSRLYRAANLEHLKHSSLRLQQDNHPRFLHHKILQDTRNGSVMIQTDSNYESRQSDGISLFHYGVLTGDCFLPLDARTMQTAQVPKLDRSRAIKDKITAEDNIKVRQAQSPLKVCYSGVRRFSSGRGSEEIKDPEAGHDSPQLSSKLLNSHSIETAEILHRNARLLVPKLPIIQDRCIDETCFHLNFDPVEYCKRYPIIQELPIPGSEQLFLRITDDGLLLFRSLANLVNALHESGHCFSLSTPLNLGNVAVSSEGKFRVRSSLAKFVPLGSSDGSGIMADYKSVATVLKDLLVQCCRSGILGDLPADILRWFHIMEIAGISDGYMICNHASLLPLRNRANAFLKFFKFIMNLNFNDKYEILKGVPVFYRSKGGQREGWHEIASGNTAIQSWFAGRGEYFKTKTGLLILHRNSFSHRENSSTDIDLLLYALYPEFLCMVQQSLWTKGKGISVESDFGDKKWSAN